MARGGTRWLDEPGEGEATRAWRDAVQRARGDTAPRETWEPERWQPDEPSPKTNKRQPEPRPPRPRRRLPVPVVDELETAARPRQGPGLTRRLADATKAYERDRYRDAAKILKPLAEAAPGAASVRELYGLTLYRLGRWNDAIREFEAFRRLTGSFDQHPTLADSYRARRRWKAVAQLWEELRAASPSAELVAEGRIVAAGALADQGKVAQAIALLDKAGPQVRRPKEHHLRMWYVLADLCERAGELPRARELFRRVVEHDRELSDAVERLAALE